MEQGGRESARFFSWCVELRGGQESEQRKLPIHQGERVRQVHARMDKEDNAQKSK